MTPSTLLRKFGICVSLLAVLGFAIFAAGASADAIRWTESGQNPPQVFADTSCTGVPGVTTDSTSWYFRKIYTGGGTFHMEGTVTQNYQSDWADGTYLISDTPSHIEFNTDNSGQAEITEAQHDIGTLYSADGQVIGLQKVVGGFHVTVANGNVATVDAWFHIMCA